jgi:hypothetical protein
VRSAGLQSLHEAEKSVTDIETIEAFNGAEAAAGPGVGRTTARNAVRTAGRIGLLHIEERPSCSARGVSDDDLAGVPHEKSGPPLLIKLLMECDKSIVY